MKGSPYKFLDYYGLEDAGIFFGREREIQVLWSDVVVNRLVVLFAPTGTGKTSLINAGVRPRLADQGYATFLVRVNKDPVESARAELLIHPKITKLKGDGLAEQLEHVVKELKNPIVIFFDQFEEFFIYIYNKNPRQGREFIANIARLYHNRESGVHLVFSMREEFLADMDAFRDEIPTIFHSDSNLRLRQFDRNQARDAIVYPARAFKVRLDSDLVERLLADLGDNSLEDHSHGHETGLIEPAQLQIVCDTLWSRSVATRQKEGRITLADYTQLGGSERGGNVARSVLYRRLEQGFSEIESPIELDLLARLLPLLKTREQTKYVRDIESLGTELAADESLLKGLIGTLEHIRFIRVSTRDRMQVVELAHDYLVVRLDDLAGRVKSIWPQRRLDQAFRDYLSEKKWVVAEDLNVIVSQLGSIRIDDAKTEFLFRSAIALGSDHMLLLFDFAMGSSIAVWPILREIIRQDESAQAINVINLCRGVASRLKDDEPSSEQADEVFMLLADALERPELTVKTQECLADLIALRSAQISLWAAKMLREHLNQVIEKGRVAAAAVAVLALIETEESISLLRRAIVRADLTLEAQDALARLTSSRHEAIASEAFQELLDFYSETTNLDPISGAAILNLVRIETKETVLLFAGLMSGEQVTDEIKLGLEKLSNSINAEVAVAARKALTEFHSVSRVSSAAQEGVWVARPRPTTQFANYQESLNRIAEKVRAGQCILFLGPGTYVPPPTDSKYKQSSYPPPLGSYLSRLLAEKSRYEDEYPRELDTNLQRVSQYFEFKFSRRVLIDHVREISNPAYPTPLVKALARMPFPIVINTNYDNRFENALNEEGKHPFVSIFDPTGETPTRDYPGNLSPDRPFVVKLFGDLQQPESVVITDDDVLHFFQRMTDKEPFNPIPITVRFFLTKYMSFQIGYSLTNFSFRMIMKMLRWKMDPSIFPETYLVEPLPDRLLSEIWSNQRRIVSIVQQEAWTFVPELYRRVMKEEMPE
jgi:hypothetical protein